MSELLKAALAVKKDLLMRAEVDSEGIKVVDVSSSIWRNFCDAIELQNTRTQSQWISVANETPTVRCLAFTPTGDVTMRYRIIPAGVFRQVASDATHWMPLPAPPKEQC